MAKPILKLTSPKDRDHPLELVFFPQDQGKAMYGGYIKAEDDGEAMPPYRVALFINTYDDGGQSFVVKGPIRERSEGHWVLTPRKNKNNEYLDRSGKVVSESKAADAFEYVKDNDGKLIFGTVATMWVTNTKKDKTPTKKTIISAKVFSDEEMLKIHEETDAEKTKELRRKLGSWTTLFIDEGFQFLRELGFTVRE